MALLEIAVAAPPLTESEVQGTWALQLTITTANQVPVVGALESTSSTFVRARLTRDGDGWVQEHQVCGAAVSGGLVKSRVPPAYTQAVPTKTYPVRLTRSDDGTLVYAADLGVFVAGADATCPDLPTEATDPCQRDFDADGHPGATVEVKVPLFDWAEVYVAQKNHLLLDGAMTSPDRIEGRIEVLDLANHVLGASKPMFHRNPTSTLVPGGSRFLLRRLPDDAGCDAVLALPRG